MSNTKILVVLALCLATVLAAGNACKKQNSVSRLSNNQPYYWPSTWNENQTAPHLEKEQNCVWNVAVPQGYYARLIIKGKTNDKDSRFQTIDSAGNLIESTQEGLEPYFFPAQRFTLVVSNDAPATFAFKIQWFPLPSTTGITGVGAIPEVINVTQSVSAMEYSSSAISLLAFPANHDHHYSLRSALIFQGPSLNTAQYVSSLYTIYRTPGQWLSSGNVIVVNVEAGQMQDQLLIQDGGRTRDIAEYVELVPNRNGTNVIHLNGHQQKSAVVTIASVTMNLTNVDIDDASVVSVYSGTPDPFTLDNMYTGVTLKKALPLSYPGGGVWQFVVKSGKATFTFQH